MSTKSELKTVALQAASAIQAANGGNGGGGAAGRISGGGVAAALVAGASPAPIVANIKDGNTLVMLSLKSRGASTALGTPVAVSVTPGTPGSFLINSLQDATPASLQTGDVSVYNYLIID